MKKKIFLLPLILAVATVTAFATPSTDSGDPRAEQAFRKQFSGAHDVSWSSLKEGLREVSFVWGGLRTIAFFNDQAELVGSVRNIFYDRLPLTVVRSVESRFGNPVVIEVTEISNGDGTFYQIKLEQGTRKYKVKLNSSGTILEKERIKK